MNSAAVRASLTNDSTAMISGDQSEDSIYLGVMILSMVGSFARLRNKHTFSMEPFSSKSCLKNLAVSMLTPIAANTTAKLS